MSEYLHKRHNVTVLIYHLAFPDKYRRVVFGQAVDGVVKDVCLEIEKRYQMKFMVNSELAADTDSRILSIGIVTFNSEKSIRRTLDSLISNLPFEIQAQIILVDNHSLDSTPAIIDRYTRQHLNISCIHNKSNLGFTRAHNQAISAAISRYHTICNPDIIVSRDIFTPLVKFMGSHPQIGMCCPKFLNIDGSLQPLNHRYPNLVDLFLRRFLPSGLEPYFNKRIKSYNMQDIGYDRSYDVQFMSGAFLFVRTAVLKAICGFDERYFLYFEDADLSRKVQQYGYRTVYFPDVSVTHAWERLAHKSWRFSWIFLKSAFQYFHKWGVKLY